MKNIIFCLTILLVLTQCTQASKENENLVQERVVRLENHIQPNLQIHKDSIQDIQYFNIENRMKELEVPGLSVAVINNGVVEWAKGYGMADIAENRKVTSETLFQAGSISKPVAATRALQLYENGTIDLDKNVNDYLTSWKLPDNTFTVEEKVTTRRILDHSAGLTVWGFPGYKKWKKIPSIPEVLDGKGNTDSVRVYKKPGESWMYSGGGYTIMQQMICDMEQKSFPQIMQENVLNPLGMTTSTYVNPLPEKYHDMAATGYDFDGTEVDGKWNIYPEMAAAGLWSTPTQLAIWGNEILQIYNSQEDGILKAKTVNEMLTISTGDYGLGVVTDELVVGHNGADAGFRAKWASWKKEGITIVMMTNYNNNSIFREVLLSIVQEYNLPGIYPKTRIIREQSKEDLKRFVGKYDFMDRGIAKLIVNNNELEFSAGPFSEKIYLLPENDTTFFNKNSGTYYYFQLKNGEPIGVKYASYEGEKID
ncbi:MAG: serine hydrolase domain-containing protein [Bacteroidota bacterium]